MKDNCIVVTGAQGDIATHIIAKLLADGNKVFGITSHEVEDDYIEKLKDIIKYYNENAEDRKETNDVEILENIPNYTVFHIDVLDSVEIREIIKRISQQNIIQTMIITHAVGDKKLLIDANDLFISEMIDVNLKSYIYFAREAISQMLKEDSSIKKDIIMISSIWGLHGAANESIYSATKGGLNAFAKAISKEYSKMNIRVNIISPGYIDTKMNDLEGESLNEIISEIPLGRVGKPKDIIAAVEYIRNSNYITGEIIGVTGGWYI